MYHSCLQSIRPLDKSLQPKIQAHLDDLTKPPSSLGRLEELALRYCLIQKTTQPKMGKKRLYCFAGDHGVVEEGVSAFPQEVTPQMVANMVAGGAAINQFCQQAGAELVVVDMGVKADLSHLDAVLHRKVRMGTRNFVQGAAMSMEECTKALEVGVDLARQAKEEGVTLLGTGEMGIGNTTPSAALFAALLPCQVEEVTGRGTGVDDQGLARKVKAIKKGLANHDGLESPLEILAALGGLEIAGIAGLILGAAQQGILVLVDGFISTAAALAAMRIKPEVLDYLAFSHRSQEQGHKVFFEQMGQRPLLDLDLRLGEGTGAALAMPLVEAALAMYNGMATFSGAQVAGKLD